jgi:protein O-mannosyl-transferase
VKPSLNRLNNLGILFSLAVILFFIFSNGLSTPFQSDDERHIYETPLIKDLNNFTNPHYIRNRHINGLSFALNYKLGQENPYGYHLFNILIHISTTFLIFFITLLTVWKGTSWSKDAAEKIALTTTILFGFHPINTEAVTYISGRPSGLAGLFYFSSLLLFILASLKSYKPLRSILYFLSLISFVMAMLSKETAVTLPVAVILYDFCFIKGHNWVPFRFRLEYYLCYPVLAAAIVYLAPNILLFMDYLNIEKFLAKINLTLGLVQLDLLKHPLRLFFFPINLTFEYDFPNHISWPSLLTSIAIVLLCMFLACKKFYLKNSLLTFCILWFPLTIAPTNSFIERTHLFSERNMYVPSFGLCLLFAVVLFLISKTLKHGTIWGACLILFICTAFSAMVLKRNQVYNSPSSLWADTFRKSPKKLSVGKTLSIHYLMEENYTSAIKTLKTMLKINPSLYDVHQNLGIAHKSIGKSTEAEKNFKEAIRIEPNDPHSHLNLAGLYGNMRKFIQASQEFDRAEALYKLKGEHPHGQFFLDKARAHNQAGIELMQLQEFDGALTQFKKSVKQNPNFLSARFNLAKLLLEFKNDSQKSKNHINAALALKPNAEQKRLLKELLIQTKN